MEYKIIDLVFPILVHFLALQLTGILGIGDAAFQTMLAAVITMPLFFWLYRKDQNLWRKEKRKITWIQWSIVIVAAAGLNILFSALMSFLVLDYGITSESQDALLSSRMLFQILGMGIAVPVTEELIFRGLVYRKLERYVSVKKAVLLGAAIFAVYHGNLLQILFAFPMGIILNLLYHRFEDLRVPVLFHAVSNLMAVLLASIAKSNKQWVILNFTDGEQQICISGGMQSLSDRSLWQITEVHRRMLHIFLKFA